MNYINKYKSGNILEKVLKEIKWAEGLKFFHEISATAKDIPVKRSRGNYECECCHKSSGQQTPCSVCGEKWIHRKKCAGLLTGDWICKACKIKASASSANEEKTNKETSILNDLPMLKEINSTSVIEQNFKTLDEIIQESLNDKTLFSIIVQRQKEFADINLEVRKMNDSLGSIIKPEELRRKRYQIDEFLRTRTENLVNDLIDQLHCAHIRGFESAKKLQILYGSDINLLEKYRNMQKELAFGLLKTQLAPLNENNTLKFKGTKFERFMDKNNPNGIYSRLNTTIDKLNNLRIEEIPCRPTTTILYGMVKVIIDGTLANCEYTPGQTIDHVGGGTDPEMLKQLLKQIREKYKI